MYVIVLALTDRLCVWGITGRTSFTSIRIWTIWVKRAVLHVVAPRSHNKYRLWPHDRVLSLLPRHKHANKCSTISTQLLMVQQQLAVAQQKNWKAYRDGPSPCFFTALPALNIWTTVSWPYSSVFLCQSCITIPIFKMNIGPPLT